MGEYNLARCDRLPAEVSLLRFDDLPGVATTGSAWGIIGVFLSVGDTAAFVMDGVVRVGVGDGSELAKTGVVEVAVRVGVGGGSAIPKTGVVEDPGGILSLLSVLGEFAR